jgi:hypothetical protein
MLHRNNKMVLAGFNSHSLHTECNDCWYYGWEWKKWSPQTFHLCIQQQLKYILYWNNVCDQHGEQQWLVSKQQNMEEVD